jgi:ferric-dicitrate binding protein FerR (iron transport regulator)
VDFGCELRIDESAIRNPQSEMNMSADNLIHRYLDDRSGLNEAELDELISLLKAEPARAVALREQLLLDDLVAQKLSVDRKNFPAQVGQRIADYERGQEEMDNQVADLRALAETEIERPTPWAGSSPWVKYIALAAALAIAAVFLVPNWLPRSPQAVAKVTAVQGDVQLAAGNTQSAAAAGTAILTGQQITAPEGSSLALEYADKTIVRISGGSRVAFDVDEATGAKRVKIDRGEVFASVRPQGAARPMRFTTPHAVATVLGTELRLTVSETTTLLDVTEGAVQLDRFGAGRSIIVETRQAGIATSERLELRELAWPASRDALAYLHTPFEFTPGGLPRMLARNPETGNFRETPLEPVGDAALNEFTFGFNLSGGYLQSADAGFDLQRVMSQQEELTLEVVLAADAWDQGGPARIVALADDGRSGNLALMQEGDELLFTLRGSREDQARGEQSSTFRFDSGQPKEPLHLTLTYRNGLLVVYLDGQEKARTDQFDGSMAAWVDGPLTVGADSSGRSIWRGSIEGFALHARCLDSAEVARNVRNFRVLAGREGK